MPAAPELPAALVEGLFPVEGKLLQERYWEALEHLGIEAERIPRFHVDAAGFSPEIADLLGNPHYLRSGVLHAHLVIVSTEQLRASLVHPSLGYAGEALRDVTHSASAQIANITRLEPLLGEVRQASTHLRSTEQLADLSKFELHFRTPGGLVRGVRKLEEMKKEFLNSAKRWLDDEFIQEMIELAGVVRGLGTLPDHFATSRHSLGLFFSPAFGGSYVLEEEGVSASKAVTYVLSSEPQASGDDDYRSARGRRVVVERLDASTAVAALLRHGIARLDARKLRDERIPERIQHWLALECLLAEDPGRRLGGSAREVIDEMRSVPSPPDDYLELEDVSRRLEDRRGRIDPDRLSPLTHLRLLTPSSSRPAVSRFVHHMQAFVDPLNLDRWWRNAPDVFYARLQSLSPERRAYFARWIERDRR